MEPRIQYAQTKAGVRIAFWTMGKGAPLVYMPSFPFSHIQLEWQMPEYRSWYKRLAEKKTVIRYDSRGTGLSEREVTDRRFAALQFASLSRMPAGIRKSVERHLSHSRRTS